MFGINGRIGFGYKTCDTAAWGVRPVLHIDISKETVWEKAEKVVVTNKIENDETTTEQITTKTVEPTTVQTTTKLVKKTEQITTSLSDKTTEKITQKPITTSKVTKVIAKKNESCKWCDKAISFLTEN